MHLFTLSIVFGCAATAFGTAVPHSHTVHEKRDVGIPKQWVKRERLSADNRLPMRIGLKQRNLHLGYDLLMDMYVTTKQIGVFN